MTADELQAAGFAIEEYECQRLGPVEKRWGVFSLESGYPLADDFVTRDGAVQWLQDWLQRMGRR